MPPERLSETTKFPVSGFQFQKPVKLETRNSKLSFGGADRDRTGDPLLAKQVLSQLSYSPLKVGGPG
jgi:hypothetical protein